MSDLNAVMERLLTDPDYRRTFAVDPGRAMAGYDLTAQEQQMLLTEVSPDTVVGSAVEQRTSKAGMFAFLGEAASLFDARGADGAFNDGAPSPAETHGMIIDGAPAPDLGGGDSAIEWTYTPAETSGIIIHGAPAETHGIIINEAPADTHGIIINEAPAETHGIIVYDMPAPDAEASSPGPSDAASVVGFDPQPDPPGQPADGLTRGGLSRAGIPVEQINVSAPQS